MKAEQLEKIVKANFAITRGWSVDKSWDIGTEAMMCLYVHFGQKYLTHMEMATCMGVNIEEIQKLVDAYPKHLRMGRFEIKRRLVERRIELDYER